jgi:hypothetical protein
MNVFNRIVVVILLIVLILLSATAIVLPEQFFGTWGNINSSLETYTGTLTGRIVTTVILLAIIVLCAFVLWLEFRRGVARTVRVEKIQGGEARVAVESVMQRAEFHVAQLPQVISVKPHVTARGKRVDLHLDVETTQEVNIPAKTEEISRTARRVVEEQMGLKLGKVIVTVRHAPAPPYEYKPASMPAEQPKAPAVQPPQEPKSEEPPKGEEQQPEG